MHVTYSTTLVASVMAALLAVPAVALGQTSPGYGTAPAASAGDPAAARPGIIGRIGIDQKLDEQVPLDLVFTNESGEDVRLGDYFGKRPVLLALVYYECPMLCTQILTGVVTTLGVMDFTVGREFDVVAVSINPREGPMLASQKKKTYVDRYGRPGSESGWHFLTGREESIAALADAVGFRYEFDKETGQYAHGAGIEILTPKGVISRYFYGIEYSARDLKFGIMEASEGRIGSAIDQVLLLCFHYDPATGKYGAAALTAVRVGAVATIAAFLSFLFVSLRRERASQRGAGSTVHRT
ncbi:SCO family protein [soil metagenome]